MNRLLAVFLVIAALSIAIIGAGAYLLTKPPSSESVTLPASEIKPDTLPGLQTGAHPWKAERENLRKRLEATGLPALRSEGEKLHTHQHLDIFINGKKVAVPTDIGVKEPDFISQIHTHDTSGIIHVESPTIQTFTLGQFFDIWGVKFTKDCIGGYCNNGQQKKKVHVNGKELTSDPRGFSLEERQQITISYGTREEEPDIPTTYKFPEGY